MGDLSSPLSGDEGLVTGELLVQQIDKIGQKTSVGVAGTKISLSISYGTYFKIGTYNLYAVGPIVASAGAIPPHSPNVGDGGYIPHIPRESRGIATARDQLHATASSTAGRVKLER